MDTLIVDTPNEAIEYNDDGNGEPLLVIHGGHDNCKKDLMQKGLDPKK